ncbi:unnamed protein product [Cochlearia groenlandica]
MVNLYMQQEKERKSGKEKSKKRFGKLRHGEPPSSIEKIFIEAEIDHNLVFKPPTLTPDRTNPSSVSPARPASSRVEATSTKPPSQRAVLPSLDSTPRPPSPKPPSPTEASQRAYSPILDTQRPPSPKPLSLRAVSPRPEPTLLVQHACATKIQSAFRGSKARKSFIALKGLARLQRLAKGYNVKRQTINAMKYMQQLVRVQSQIQSRRVKRLENQSQVEKDDARKAETEASNDTWDDSMLTKQEKDARSQKKIDAIAKRERSMAYAHSHKLSRNSPKSTQDIGSSGRLSLWWKWMDHKLLLASHVPSQSQPLRDNRLTPTKLTKGKARQNSNLKKRTMSYPPTQQGLES